MVMLTSNIKGSEGQRVRNDTGIKIQRQVQ